MIYNRDPKSTKNKHGSMEISLRGRQILRGRKIVNKSKFMAHEFKRFNILFYRIIFISIERLMCHE